MECERVLPRVRDAFAKATGLDVPDDRLHIVRDSGIDLLMKAGRIRFAFKCTHRASSTALLGAIRQLQAYRAGSEHVVGVVVVPFMGEVGKQLCREAGVSWLDLSGNAGITAPGLRVKMEGRPNIHTHPGRPENLFSPVSSRLARLFLPHPQRAFTGDRSPPRFGEPGSGGVRAGRACCPGGLGAR